MSNLKAKLSAFIKENKGLIIFSSVIWAFFMFLVFLAPFSGDDWAWGTEMGVSRVKSFFVGYNGRYVGNYLIFLLSRSELLQVIVVSLAMMAVCYLPLFIMRKKSLSMLALGVLALFIMPHSVFIQVIMWASGFTNYMPPIIITLAYIAIVNNIFRDEMPIYKRGAVVASAILGFLGNLFMENVTIYNVMVAVFVIVLARIKFKKSFSAHWAYFIGAICGMVLMFANSAYFRAASGTDFYRSFAWKDLTMIFNHLSFLCTRFFAEGFLSFILISALLIPLAICTLRKAQEQRTKVWLYVALCVNLVTLGIITAKRIFGSWEIVYNHPNASVIVFALVVILHFLSIFLLTAFTVQNKEYKLKLSFMLISVPLLLGPFLIISPLNARCITPAYIILSVFTVLLFDYVRTSLNISKEGIKVITISVLALSLGIYLFFVSIYTVVRRYEYLRIEYIEKQIEAGITEEVVLAHLPYSSYVWMETPFENNALWEGHFKHFYGLDEDITFKNVSTDEFDRWMEEFDKKHG